MRVLAVDGSPTGAGRTLTAIEAVLAGAGVEAEVLGLAEADGVDRALAAAEESDAFVLGSPMYRASYAAPLKAFLDRLPRGMWGEQTAPITARPVVIAGTGATWHHYLGLDPLRSILAGFFCAHVIPPGLYVPHEGFDEERRLRPDFEAAAQAQGAALAELGEMLPAAPALTGLRPQA
jgi:FMN reductase